MKILYVCTHNRCRSILSEAITQQLSGDRLIAFSAGSQPAGQVHPLSLKYLEEKGYDTNNLISQSWDDFESEQPDIVITVCDSAANEPCPVWFGDTLTVHWSLPDPSKLDGGEVVVKEAFFDVIKTIEQRVQKLLDLNLESMSRNDLQAALTALTKTH